MPKIVFQIIKALLDFIKEYQKNQRLLAEAKKNAEAMEDIDKAFEGDGNAQNLNDTFMHRNKRVPKSPDKGD